MPPRTSSSDTPPPAPRLFSRSMALVFALLLALPTLALFPAFKPAPLDLQENRQLAPWPDLAATPIRQLPRAIELYVADHFPFRTHLVAAYIMVMERWLGVPVDAHLLGKEGELFFVMSQENTVRDYMGMKPLAQDELLRRRAYLTGLKTWCEGQGVAYLFMLGPNKTTIHPEWLPDWVEALQGESRQEQFLAMMADTPVQVLDTAPGFLARKGEARLFNVLSDTAHWNGRGLRLANELLLERVQVRMPQFSGRQIADAAGHMALRDELAVTVYDEDVVPILYFTGTEALRYDHTPAFQAAVAEMPRIWLKPYRIVNDALPDTPGSTVLFATDSYFSTHVGQNGQPDTPWFPTPLPYLFHTFVHFHHDAMTRKTLERFFQEEKPSLLVHAYAERSMLWPWGALMDPEFMALGEVVLGSPVLELTQTGRRNAGAEEEVAWDLREEKTILLPEIHADGFGRVVVAGRVQRVAGEAPASLTIRGGHEDVTVPLNGTDELFCVPVPCAPGGLIQLTAIFHPQGEGRWLVTEPELLRRQRTAGGN
ncbi:alginate O-acetyltransferase AlgX-related protein [Megalodesulfovibrio paquesii]